jgi:hypothetical protein
MITPILEHLLAPSVGVAALHPRTSGYSDHHFSIDAISIQEDTWGINLKIFSEKIVLCIVIPDEYVNKHRYHIERTWQ